MSDRCPVTPTSDILRPNSDTTPHSSLQKYNSFAFITKTIFVSSARWCAFVTNSIALEIECKYLDKVSISGKTTVSADASFGTFTVTPLVLLYSNK